MKISRLSFLFVLCIFSFTTITSAQTKNSKSLLWEVSGKGLSKPSYLYGTFHLLCPADLKPSPVIDEKLKSSKKLFLEMDMDDPAIMQKVQAGIMMKDSSWKSLLTDDEFKSLSDSFKHLTSMPIDMFTQIKPFGLISVVMMGMMECQPASWDMTLAQKAKENNIEVKGLETPERELEAINTITIQEQTDMLKEMLNNPDSTKRSLQQMIAIYKDKDLGALREMMTSDKKFGSIETELLTKRNNEWVPEIEKQSATEPTFFAFGAGHLAGDNGIIALLKKKGYTVKAVEY